MYMKRKFITKRYEIRCISFHYIWWFIECSKCVRMHTRQTKRIKSFRTKINYHSICQTRYQWPVIDFNWIEKRKNNSEQKPEECVRRNRKTEQPNNLVVVSIFRLDRQIFLFYFREKFFVIWPLHAWWRLVLYLCQLIDSILYIFCSGRLF